eukprot:m.90565 g.90565  ORF g.90565 m.90565 type:complete len:343 (-) comp8467_c0_seq3:1443-2471(-)
MMKAALTLARGCRHARHSSSLAGARELVGDALKCISPNIKKTLDTPNRALREASHYYFDDKGKLFRPLTIMLMARACAPGKQAKLDQDQQTIAMIAEMIHTASLMHDDVIDQAVMRRGKPSINAIYGDEQSIIAGDYVLARAAMTLAAIGNARVVELLSQVIEDLVRGELQQLGASASGTRSMDLYLHKTYLKTASLLACSCHAVAVLAECPAEMQDAAFAYGRHLGICFQVVDDILDVVSSTATLGKESAVDMKLGLATAPVLYACDEFPELHGVIARQFSGAGDVAAAVDMVRRSSGIEKARALAAHHRDQAVAALKSFRPSPHLDNLRDTANVLLDRSS